MNSQSGIEPLVDCPSGTFADGICKESTDTATECSIQKRNKGNKGPDKRVEAKVGRSK